MGDGWRGGTMAVSRQCVKESRTLLGTVSFGCPLAFQFNTCLGSLPLVFPKSFLRLPAAAAAKEKKERILQRVNRYTRIHARKRARARTYTRKHTHTHTHTHTRTHTRTHTHTHTHALTYMHTHRKQTDTQ